MTKVKVLRKISVWCDFEYELTDEEIQQLKNMKRPPSLESIEEISADEFLDNIFVNRDSVVDYENLTEFHIGNECLNINENCLSE